MTQMKRKWEDEKQQSDLASEIPQHLSILKHPKENCHNITCEPRGMFLKFMWSVSLMRKGFNAYVFHSL